MSASVMVMFAPVSPFFSLLSSSTTSAVITFVTLAAGMACSLPEVPTNPRPENATAADPIDGQGSDGAVPGATSVVWRRCVAATAGVGRRELEADAATTRSSQTTPTPPHIPQK